jgi:catechol 2,3-dioxygenase-like lactoylglutathione lyase family enzyme
LVGRIPSEVPGGGCSARNLSWELQIGFFRGITIIAELNLEKPGWAMGGSLSSGDPIGSGSENVKKQISTSLKPIRYGRAEHSFLKFDF